VLSGSLDDGSAGLFAIKQRGGVAIVQDPNDAIFPSMPRHALMAVDVDYCSLASEIAPLLVRLAREKVEESETAVPTVMKQETAIEAFAREALESEPRPGKPSVFGCPDCGGTLWELDEDELLRFRCRVGHAYTAENLADQQDQGVEKALWSALRALEEKAALARRIASRARRRNNHIVALRYEAEAEKAHQQSKVIHNAIVHNQLTEE